ncbi:MAG: hypothetical protein KAS21_08365 [Candidatus Aminicenantes bacterium]|nr:hypothetical protein [Candidatus Aminicenantes bacterium]MCK5005088.1 hypothetical protein [Candidatus Aminicenantes bacterium]
MNKKIFFLILIIFASTLVIQPEPAKTGIGFRTGYFGIPDQLLDLIMFEHPGIEGKFYSLEIRSYGPSGNRSVFSGLYSLEISNMKGEGQWRLSQDDARIEGYGEVSQINFTATIIMCLLPGLPVRPYIGGGIGIGYINLKSDAMQVDELGTTIDESFNVKKVIPVGHLPVGVMINPTENIELRIEGGFKNGFYFSGSFVFTF